MQVSAWILLEGSGASVPVSSVCKLELIFVIHMHITFCMYECIPAQAELMDKKIKYLRYEESKIETTKAK